MKMKTSPNDVSNKEILQELREELRTFSKQVNDRFDGIDGRLNKVDARLDGIDGRLDGVDGRLGVLEASNQEILEVTNSYATIVDTRLGRLEREQTRMSANMVTKGYLDDKMADLRSDMSQNTRRQIEKAIG